MSGSKNNEASCGTTLERMQEVMRSVFMDDALVVGPRTTALDVDGWDSLSHSMLMLELEQAFGIELAPERVARCADVGELAALVEASQSTR